MLVSNNQLRLIFNFKYTISTTREAYTYVKIAFAKRSYKRRTEINA
jgi:hypothetical protein